jgi:UDP-3-O-[3-hydroxymyristoyl] glucosamine N-acyltransferase
MKLGELAAQLGLELHGDADCEVQGVAVLHEAGPGQLSFLANPKYRKFLADTRASAVILGREDREHCRCNVLVSDNPYLSYARAAALLHPVHRPEAGVSEGAWVDPAATIDGSAHVAPGCVIESGAEIAGDVIIGPNCVVGRNCRIGQGTRLVAGVTLCADSQVGSGCVLHPGVVIGGDGFGLAPDGQGRWERVPQLGRVVIGDDVDIGANTTVDRGAIGDTVIRDGAKLDNLIQIAHNVEIGEGTAIAACVGISGSSKIGRNCTLAGGVGLVGHIELADNVHVSGFSMVTRSISEPGVYAGGIPAISHAEWGRNFARIRKLDDMAKRIRELEKQLAAFAAKGEAPPQHND